MTSEKQDFEIGRAPSMDNMDDLKSLDSDALKLAEMGYTQDMKRNYSVLSVLGVGFSLTNSWFGISAALITGINSGGPICIVYGIILIALISTCVGISLSELASAYPNAGGQYFWANELAPRRYANFASYLTGWFAWAGSIFTSASVALAVGSAGVGCWALSHPDLQVTPVFPCILLTEAALSIRGMSLLATKLSIPFLSSSIAMGNFSQVLERRLSTPHSSPFLSFSW